ncbi:MAG: molybdopterin-dependent oxidoreductase [Thermoplasmata archaeon]|nr:molybdopterin-dependent oxidoreductase [Thermoplasmata archaeon]
MAEWQVESKYEDGQEEQAEEQGGGTDGETMEKVESIPSASKEFPKTALAILVVAILIAATSLVYISMTNDDDRGGGETPGVLIIGGDGMERELSLEDLKGIQTATGDARAQNKLGNWRGMGTYEGALLSSIIEEIGGMSENDSITVTAEDGYFQNLSYKNVYPDQVWQAFQGDFIIAFSFNSTEIPDWEEGPKLVNLPLDGDYSLEDCALTSALGQGYYINPSAAGRWVANVERIEIVPGGASSVEGGGIATPAQGASIEIENMSMDIPAGAVTEITTFDVQYSPATENAPADTTPMGGTYDIGPTGTVFSIAVTLSFDYDHGSIPTCLDTDDLQVGLYNETSSTWHMLGGTVDSVNDTIEVQVFHLSRYAVFAVHTEATLLTVVGRDGTSMNMSLSDLKGLENMTGTAAAQNKYGNWRGNGSYTGSILSAIADELGGMLPGDILVASASPEDGYYQNFTYYNVYPDEDWQNMQGEYVLAYSMDGNETPEWEDGPKLVCLPPDGEFSQQDCNWTSALGQGYNNNPSASARWVRNVVRIEIVQGSGDWNVTLKGNNTKVLSGTEYAMFKNWYRSDYTDGDNRTWSGVPLWRIMALVDGGDARGNDSFDPGYKPFEDSIGYDVEMEALDGYVKYLPNGTLQKQSGILLLADSLNGTALDTNGPVKIIAPEMKKSYWVSAISRLSLVPAWDLELYGEENDTITYSELITKDSVSGIAYAYKVSYPTLPINGPWNYTGIEMIDLVSMVWNTTVPYTVEVVANDGYSLTLTQDEAEGRITVYDMEKNELGVQQVRTILAFEQDGERWFSGGPLRLTFVNDTGAVTDYGLHSKFVKEIHVMERISDWALNITMNITGQDQNTTNIDRIEFEHAAQPGKHYANVTIENSTYEGIPLWILIGAVDGNDTDTHWGFNDTLAAGGYNVTVWAEDGYNRAFTIDQLARNDSIIVAYMKDGERLSGNEWPLRLIADGFSGADMVSNIMRIELVDPV